jgi:transposase
MNKDIKYFEIDISYLVFDITDCDGNYYQFKNNKFGFKKFLKLLNSLNLCAMESTILELDTSSLIIELATANPK